MFYDTVPTVMTRGSRLLYYPYCRKPVPSGVELDKLGVHNLLSLYLKSILVGFETSIKNQFKDLAVLDATRSYALRSRGNEPRMVTRPPCRNILEYNYLYSFIEVGKPNFLQCFLTALSETPYFLPAPENPKFLISKISSSFSGYLILYLKLALH